MRFYSLAKTNAEQFVKDGKKNVRIAKAKRKNSHVVLLEDEKPTKNFEVLEKLN
ncbi:hypothetical protein [Lacrimispora indolis]|uniref:hypothetical protein n=1 Tax=Lacrimispora indolis TaxID=69825 RepID=UPI0004B54BC3|nr:hypothetical protein [Lacrimispora indolis]